MGTSTEKCAAAPVPRAPRKYRLPVLPPLERRIVFPTLPPTGSSPKSSDSGATASVGRPPRASSITCDWRGLSDS